MLKVLLTTKDIVKELMAHKEYSVMQNPEYWKNDENFSFDPIVDYVSKELHKLFASEIRCGLYNLPNYKYIREYMDLIAMDIKAGFYLGLTDNDVEEKDINFSNGFPIAVHDIENYLGVYLKVTYAYKLRPEKQITVYYVFGNSSYNGQMSYISHKSHMFIGHNNTVDGENSLRFYNLFIYLLVNSIDVKTPEDFNTLDIVIPCLFDYRTGGIMRRIGLMEVSELIKREKDKKKINERARQHYDNILRSPLEKIVNVTEKVLYELLPKEANEQILKERN